MVAAGLWKPRRQRAAQIHQPRNRRACVGELTQIDGSDHAWFEDSAEACTLLVYIDDATSRLMQLHCLSRAYVRYDKLPFIDAAAIVENKRLSHALRVAQVIQSQRDDRRSQSMPSRTNSGAKPRPKRAETGKKRPRKFTLDGMNAAMQRNAA